jgi:hypothetical protein
MKLIQAWVTKLLALTLAACAATPEPPPSAPSEKIVLFSQATPGKTLPPGWQPLVIRPDKKQTDYDFVSTSVDVLNTLAPPQTVLRARAKAASSGLKLALKLNVREQPWLRWQWKINNLLPQADLTSRYDEDSPVRILVSFDGDREKLSGKDRLFIEKVRLFTGQELPYATLMYVWDNQQPLEKIIPNASTSRIQKIVVQSGAAQVGRWHSLERNVLEDYRRVFNEEPGELLAIGVMTDTDNTQSEVEAFYGDINFYAQPQLP